MEVFQIDDAGLLYISPDIDSWEELNQRNIRAVFDLDEDLDIGVPNVPNHLIYVYFPFEDRYLPELQHLHELARLGASLIHSGCAVLSHCGMGHNRSALLAGLILIYMGMPGEDAVRRLQSRRQGALYNKIYAQYLASLPAAALPGH
jgi:protein-tyrosine phosphatase